MRRVAIGWLAVGAAVVLSSGVVADEQPKIPDPDRIRIAEAFRLADDVGNRIWPQWDKAPFAVLLITPDYEFLLRHPAPSGDFALAGKDDVLKCDVWYRKRQFATNLLATFPAVGGVSTIVIGQAENTEAKTSTPWVLTLLHEHFHQLQNSQPGYFAAVDELNLARGDTTGMWMLDYPFPYATPGVQEGFATMSRALATALDARADSSFASAFPAYEASRAQFHSLLSADDYRYFAFQVWQEGIARYTECRVAELAAAEYKPSKEFKALPDFRPFDAVATEMMGRVNSDLESPQLDHAGRTAVYSVGAAEGLILDRARPGWRKHYFEEKFTLDPQFRPM